MIRHLLLLAAFTLFKKNTFEQVPNYVQLIDSAIRLSGVFIAAQPSKHIRLDITDTSYYKEFLQGVYQYKIETGLLIELINNSINIDASYWADSELKNSIVVKNRNEFIKLKDVIKKFNLVEKEKIKRYRKLINEFNNTSSWDKNIFYFSRPVFDNSKQFAAISYENGHSGFGGGGSVTLFHFTNGVWREIGDITRWKH